MSTPSVARTDLSGPNAATSPTHGRHVTLALMLALAVITYIDRVSLSTAAPIIRDELGLSSIQLGWALSTFAWAYALFEVPGGWLGDRLGPRRILMRIVIWWSIFTAATGQVWSLASLVICQALFGAGEAGAFPNITRVFTTWIPTRERERAQALLWLATRWGGALTPLAVKFVLGHVSWRLMFAVFGGIGVIWAIVFYRWHRDDPATHPAVNAAELALLPPPRSTSPVKGSLPWRALLSHRSVVLLCLQYGCLAYGWFFYVTWLPTYLRDARHTPLEGSPLLLTLLSGAPLLLGGVGCLVSGWLGPRLAARLGSVTLARRVLAITGFAGASAAIVVFTRIQDPVQAMVVLGIAGFLNDFVMPNAWASTMDVGGRYAGTVSGAMNMCGAIAGACSTLIVGYILAWAHQDWTLALYLSASIYLIGGLCWFFLDPHTPLEQP
jgi:MFS transporter, ACS family, glucarate transporter